MIFGPIAVSTIFLVQLRLMKAENSVADKIHSELFAVSVVIDVVSDWAAV